MHYIRLNHVIGPSVLFVNIRIFLCLLGSYFPASLSLYISFHLGSRQKVKPVIAIKKTTFMYQNPFRFFFMPYFFFHLRIKIFGNINPKVQWVYPPRRRRRTGLRKQTQRHGPCHQIDASYIMS